MIQEQEAQRLRSSLHHWHECTERYLPWKEHKNPYHTWVSEIILQQTRVAQGIPYYHRFVEAFPDVIALADAGIDQVLLLWQGLGYYSRARNMHSAAQHIRDELDGVFPNTYEGLLRLKGVGEYTAAAIASFSYDLPHAVVDGNVKRVISRYCGIATEINTSQGHKEIVEATRRTFDNSRPALFNQAIMNLGAMVCTPKSPKCQECPWRDGCIALRDGLIDILPTKKKSKPKSHRYFRYIWYDYKGMLAIRRRDDTGIWKGLYELPYTEYTSKAEMNNDESLNILADNIKHILSHQVIHADIVHIDLSSNPAESDWIWIPAEDLRKYSMPRILTKAFEGIITPRLPL